MGILATHSPVQEHEQISEIQYRDSQKAVPGEEEGHRQT